MLVKIQSSECFYKWNCVENNCGNNAMFIFQFLGISGTVTILVCNTQQKFFRAYFCRPYKYLCIFLVSLLIIINRNGFRSPQRSKYLWTTGM